MFAIKGRANDGHARILVDETRKLE